MVRAYLKQPNDHGLFQWFPFTDFDGITFKFESDQDAREKLERAGYHLCVRNVGPYNFKTIAV